MDESKPIKGSGGDAGGIDRSEPVRAFPSTHWAHVHSAAKGGTTAGLSPLEMLVRRYEPVVLRYLASRFHVAPDDAQDLWQGFVTSRILAGDLLVRADPERGRFRNLLVRALDRFVVSQLRHQRARKRAPKQQLLQLEGMPEMELPIAQSSSDDESELSWARAVVAGALLNMRAECESQRHDDIWIVFSERVLLPILEDKEPLDYGHLVERCRFASATQACNALTTAKRMFRRHLKAVIEEYAGDDAEAADELVVLQRRLDRQA